MAFLVFLYNGQTGIVMLVYKVTFVNNKILSCVATEPAKNIEMKDDIFYSQIKGLLIFALIKANSKEQALEKAAKLIKDVSNGQASSSYYSERYTPGTNSSSLPYSTPDFIDTTSSAPAE